MLPDDATLLAKARNCLEMEADAIRDSAEHLGEGFTRSIQAIANAITGGKKLVFSGIGKNVPICQKLAFWARSIISAAQNQLAVKLNRTISNVTAPMVRRNG